MKPGLWAVLLCTVALLCACAKEAAPDYQMSSSYGAADAGGGAPRAGAAPAPAAPGAPAEASMPQLEMKTNAAKDISTIGMSPQRSDQRPDDTAPDATPVSRQRMVHYNGFARLRVTQVRETLDQVVKTATDAGGYVERLSGSSVTIRVPVARFQEVFAQVLHLGDVLSKSVTAEDVTDAYQAVDLRLQTARATRERLVALLARAKTEEEKLQLLREIQRVTEEIDRLEAQIKTLASLAAFSRISVEAAPREALSARSSDEEIAELRWIQALSPFRRDVARQGRLLKLRVPDGMVVLDETRHWVAESADGAVLWTGKLENHPEGDTGFWLEALRTRLAPEFATAEVKEVGGFKVLRLVDRSEKPYTYLVGVRVQGDELHLIEAYYPTDAQEKRYGNAVMASIEKGEP